MILNTTKLNDCRLFLIHRPAVHVHGYEWMQYDLTQNAIYIQKLMNSQLIPQHATKQKITTKKIISEDDSIGHEDRLTTGMWSLVRSYPKIIN